MPVLVAAGIEMFPSVRSPFSWMSVRCGVGKVGRGKELSAGRTVRSWKKPMLIRPLSKVSETGEALEPGPWPRGQRQYGERERRSESELP